MKRLIFLGLVAVFLAAFSTAAFSGEWTSKTSTPQRHGPKFSDYINKHNKSDKTDFLDKHKKKKK